MRVKLGRRGKFVCAWALAGLILAAGLLWGIGGVLVAPANHPLGPAPASLHVENVEFPSASGSTISGWFVPGQPGRGAVALLHGVHADRSVLTPRAEWSARAGYAVLLFDFQAHGLSPGRHITFRYSGKPRCHGRRPLCANPAARRKNRGDRHLPGGAAAAQLASPPLPVDALVLESSDPTIYQATEDRLAERFGWLGRLATPLLTCQLQPRLGIRLEELKPLECARKITVPKFYIAGTADRNTTLQESRDLFAAAAGP